MKLITNNRAHRGEALLRHPHRRPEQLHPRPQPAGRLRRSRGARARGWNDHSDPPVPRPEVRPRAPQKPVAARLDAGPAVVRWGRSGSNPRRERGGAGRMAREVSVRVGSFWSKVEGGGRGGQGRVGVSDLAVCCCPCLVRKAEPFGSLGEGSGRGQGENKNRVSKEGDPPPKTQRTR